MKRFAVGLALSAFAGCVSPNGPTPNGAPISTPDPSKISTESLQTAERVQLLGQRIIEQNTFTGIAPLFHTLSVPTPILFHRGPDELFVSEAVVNRCETDAQLAAVLCTELGRMMAEKRAAKGLGVELTSVRDGAPDRPLGDGQIASAPPTPEPPKPVNSGEKPDAMKLTRELMTGAGFDPVVLNETTVLLKDVKSGDALGKQIAGPAPAPLWQQ